MFIGLDLGEALGFGRAGGVASCTEHGAVGFLRDHRGWIGGMIRERSVASFAVHMNVFAMVLGIGDIGVAFFARLVARKFHLPGGDVVNGRSAIVAVLTERFGNYESANAQKHKESQYKESREPEEVPSIFKKIHQAVSEGAEIPQRRFM